MKQIPYYRLWAEVDLDAIRSNVLTLRSGLGKETRICAVIKADGYGHGAVAVARALKDLADFYAVATMDEALELRQHGIRTPVLILGYVQESFAETAILHDIRLTVYSLDMARQIAEAAQKLGRTARIHVKLDTGMGRIGFSPERESAATIKEISALPGIVIEGLYTHFANADGETAQSALEQMQMYRTFLGWLEEAGITIPVRHCANSAAATCLRETDMDMVRLGISIYGLYPSAYVRQVELTPALSLKSHVILVKTIPAGTSVGYGSTWTAKRDSRIATVSVGYADGYSRSLSNQGFVLIRGDRYPIAGRVCMDQIMVDVTGGLVEQGDEVILIGGAGEKRITMEEISELAGSFNYEFACGLSRRVPRIYYQDGKETAVLDYFHGGIQEFVAN